jgi:peptide/nickel transport system substrate-binding protein
MADDKSTDHLGLPKMSFNRKDMSRRMRRVESVTVRHARKFIFKRWNNARDVRRHIATWVITIGVIIGASGLQLMWYQRAYVTQGPATDSTYAEAVLGPVNTLDPLFASSDAEQSASQLLFSRLLDYDSTGHLSNDLATNVSINDTKTVYTVTMRSDAKWTDGSALTARDVAFTVGLLKNASVRSTITGWDDISAVALNDTTVQFTLPAVYAAFEHALTFPILPQHILNNVDPSQLREDSFSSAPIGSGPFALRFVQTVDASTGNEVIQLARNDNYYQGAAKLTYFQLHVYNDQDAMMQALSSGEVNAASGLSLTEMSQINTKNETISIKPIQAGVYALLNTKSPLLQDKAIRQALQIGTNTDAVRQKLGTDIPSLYLPFTRGQLFGDVPAAPVFNPAAAEKLLDDDGWKLVGSVRQKAGVPLKLSVVTTKDSDFEAVLEVLAGQWRSLGIDVETQIVDPNDVSQNIVQNVLQPRAFDVLLYQLTIGADPDVYAYWHSSQANPNGFNFSNYSNPISDDALSSARSRLEPDLRNAKYLTFARQWLSDVPAIGLYQSTTQYVHNNNTQSVQPTDTLVSPVDRYADVLYWSVGTRPVYKTP